MNPTATFMFSYLGSPPDIPLDASRHDRLPPLPTMAYLAGLIRVPDPDGGRRTIEPTRATNVNLEACTPASADGMSLFLDLDVPLIDRSAGCGDGGQGSSHVAAQRALRLEGRLAIVSGRSIDQLDYILGPLSWGRSSAGKLCYEGT